MGQSEQILHMGKGTKMNAASKRILIINVNWIGDVIFSTPFIKAVRDAYPDSHIACLVHPRCVEVLKGSPRIDEIIAYDEELPFYEKMRLCKKQGRVPYVYNIAVDIIWTRSAFTRSKNKMKRQWTVCSDFKAFTKWQI